MFLPKKNFIRILFYFLFIILILLFFAFNAVICFLNTDYIQNKLFQAVNLQTGFTFSVKKIDLDIFPSPAIKLKQFNIHSKNKINLTIPILIASFDFKKLFQKQLILNKIILNDPKLNLDPNKILLISKKNTNLLNHLKSKSHLIDLLKIDLVKNHTNKTKGTLIQINNFKSDFGEKYDLNIKLNKENTITGDIKITNCFLNKQLMKKYNFDGKIFNLQPSDKKDLIKIKTLKADFKITEDTIQAAILPAAFTYPLMTLGVNFRYNIKSKKGRLEFLGNNINIDQGKKAYFTVFNKEIISMNLFDTVRAGTASKIRVLFKDANLKDMLSPMNMVLEGELKNGRIKIPQTALIPGKVFGTALIKNGILYIKAEKANLKSSKIMGGTLEIDLLNSIGFPFHGLFKIHAPLADIQSVLIQSFPDTLIKRELKLIKKINGHVYGELKLKLEKGKNLKVSVSIDKVSGSVQYSRAPGTIKINKGKFIYNNDIIKLQGFTGKIGNNNFVDLKASYCLDGSRKIDIKSCQGLVHADKTFTWLTSFKTIKTIIPDLSIKKGYLQFNALSVKGDILKPETLKFSSCGVCKDLVFTRVSGENVSISNNISLRQCDWSITDQKLSINNIQASISDTGLISTFSDNTAFHSLKTPFIVKDAAYKSEKNSAYFSAKINLSTGPEIILSAENKNNLNFILKKLQIKDKPDTNIVFRRDKQKGISLLKFKGQINTKTLDKIFDKSSQLYKDIINCTDKREILIKSKDTRSYFINAETINLESLLNKLFSQDKTQSFLKVCTDFSKKIIIIKTNSALYKKSVFKNFQTNINIRKNSKGFNGNLNFTTYNGKIHQLTLLSRILSIINISTIFKGKLPDIKQSGFKYNSIHFKSDIVNNKIIIKEAVIDGHDMALVFKGTINPANNHLNLTCLVAPFKTIDILIEKVPVISTMLNNTLISIPVKISGNINDPKVTPMHPFAIGTGMINLMTNIIKTPIKLWNKYNKK